MESAAKKFFKDILETPSPSGYEQPVQEIVRKYVADFADDVRTDLHGNVIASCNTKAPLPRDVRRPCRPNRPDRVAHQRERLHLHEHDRRLGSAAAHRPADDDLHGQRPVPAVIARKAIHLLDEEERKKVVKTKELWLDIGAKDKEEAAAVVAIGDPVTLELGYQEMRNNLANSPGMDDKTGLWVAVEALRRAKKRGGLKVASVRGRDRAGRNRPARRDHQRVRR